MQQPSNGCSIEVDSLSTRPDMPATQKFPRIPGIHLEFLSISLYLVYI